MDSVVYEDTPLAAYLQEEGDEADATAVSQPEPSFAPRGPPTIRSRLRSTLQRFQPSQSPDLPIASHLRQIFSTRLSKREDEGFVEQFRYIIIASQLLSEPVNSLRAKDPTATDHAGLPTHRETQSLSPAGAALTASGVFLIAWMLHWARGGRNVQFSKTRWLVASTILAFMGFVLWAYIKRQRALSLRHLILERCSSFTNVAHAFDSTALAGLALIQEVEVVSRGYRISTPLPPISRLDESSDGRRCNRLRKSISDSLVSCIEPFAQVYEVFYSLAEKLDLERYFDIYEIHSDEINGIRLGADSLLNGGDVETLMSLKALYRQVHSYRKILLCCLLAMSADDGSLSEIRWVSVAASLEAIQNGFVNGEKRIRHILDEEDAKSPASPKTRKILTLDAGNERVQSQMRRFNILSSGIRSLQAKMHILREDSDRSLDESDDVTQSGQSLMQQYESIGEDIQILMQEWEVGKAALASNIDKNERRISQLTSPTLSLGGTTDVDSGSPSEALKVLNGEMSSDDEVFEAVAVPKQRNPLSREERIAKMKEERVRSAANRESREANTRMLKELETVINLRPRGKTSGRITSI